MRPARAIAVAVAVLTVTAIGTTTAAAVPEDDKVCSVEGVWEGEFNSTEGNPNLGAVTLIIEQRHRKFFWQAVTTTGQVAAGHGTIAASGQSHIVGEGPTLKKVSAKGVVMCLADMGFTATFEYMATMETEAGTFQDRGTANLVHVVPDDEVD